MVITDEQIMQAEKLLLKQGQFFDGERRAFIKRLETGDLMAVPGSGKTTALQAKLYCMAQHLPLKDGKGILVLSHTNTAVDELKRRLQAKCPYLFEYPNFIGTIQQFVDKFLAIPFYEQRFQHGVDQINDTLYEKTCEEFVIREFHNHSEEGYSYEANYLLRHMNEKNSSYKNIRFEYRDGNRLLVNGPSGNELSIKPAKKWIKEDTADYKIGRIMEFIKKMKVYALSKGRLHYDDCYFLAESYLRTNPEIINVIKERFIYVFVDEAQDIQKHQLNLLDQLFDGTDKVVYQLVGDPNQSIFSSHSKSMTLQWFGKNPCFINNSIRLTPQISKVVNNLVMIKGQNDESGEAHFSVTGLRVLEQEIAPQMILFDTTSMPRLKDKFKELIRLYNLVEEDRYDKHGFHIIGWVATKNNNADKLHLEDIFTDYLYNSSDMPYSTDTLSKTIQNEKLKGNFKASRNLVLDCFFHTLYLMGVRDEDGRGFNKAKLSKTLDGKNENERRLFNEALYSCTVSLAAGKWENAYNNIKPFITTWANTLYNAYSNESAKAFLGNQFEAAVVIPTPAVIVEDDIPIEIGTVHSAKGQTHCATMYVETFFERKYECEHLLVTERGEEKNPLFGDDIETTGVYAQMARKMMYVGFSRPTHLLCYATEKKRWTDANLQKMRDQGWVVIDLT